VPTLAPQSEHGRARMDINTLGDLDFYPR